MNKNLYRKIIIAMMVTTLGGASAFAEDAAQVSAESAPKAPVSVAKVRPVDVTPALREELARQIAAESEKKAQKRAAKKEQDPVIVIGRVAPDQAVELTLPKTVQMALDYNRDIKVAHYDLKSAEYYIDEAKAGKMPQFNYTFDATRRENSGSSGINNRDSITNSFGHGLSVNIPLYTGGRVEGQIAVAKLGKTSAQEEILRVEQATKLSAVQGYFGLLPYVLVNAAGLLNENDFRKWTEAIRPEVKEHYRLLHKYRQELYNPAIGKIQETVYNWYLKSNRISSGQKNYAEVVGMILSLPEEWWY